METCKSNEFKRAAAVAGIGAIAGIATYTLFVRKWHNRWGATDAELAMALPGDEIVARPNMNSTRAITINASPEDIWPWLVQMGKGRGGLYSYDWLDMAFKVLDKPSSRTILQEHQGIKAGDLIPIGSDDSTADDFYVHQVERNNALVIGANDPAFRHRVSWAMALNHVGPDQTRLIIRVRGDVPLNPKGIVTYALLEPAAFVMLRKQMINIKRLAETTCQRRTALAA